MKIVSESTGVCAITPDSDIQEEPNGHVDEPLVDEPASSALPDQEGRQRSSVAVCLNHPPAVLARLSAPLSHSAAKIVCDLRR